MGITGGSVGVSSRQSISQRKGWNHISVYPPLGLDVLVADPLLLKLVGLCCCSRPQLAGLNKEVCVHGCGWHRNRLNEFMDLHIPPVSPAPAVWELFLSVFWKLEVIKIWPFA